MAIHQCNFCSYKSERLSNLERHRLRKHIVAPPQVVRASQRQNPQNMHGKGFGKRQIDDNLSEYNGDGDFFSRSSTDGSDTGYGKK